MRTILLTVLTILVLKETHAQTKPAENDTLNYRIAGFTVPQNKDAAFYRFEIALRQAHTKTIIIFFNKFLNMQKRF